MAHSTVARPDASPRSLDAIEAMARLARRTETVVHLVLPREPGIVENARVVAYHAGIEVSVDVLARTVRVRLDGRRP